MNTDVPSQTAWGPGPIHAIDSHTEGEPTRVIVEGGPNLGSGSLAERLEVFRHRFDSFRSATVCEPRGSDVVVGALLCTPLDPAAAAGVIFFNDVGYLGMCGHGTIGLVRTLSYLGRIQPGKHLIETPVGTVHAELHADGGVSVQNVPSYRYRASVSVDVPGIGILHGDIAWGGNWFLLIGDHPFSLVVANRDQLVAATKAIRTALQQQGITGQGGSYIDHIELFGPASSANNSSRNFVLCPGASFDRSPCGTGTSAKMACLYADGKLAPGELWQQEGILGTHFTGSIQPDGDRVIPTITGRAWITADITLLFDSADPFAQGIAF
ncbi:4-hydroxyproline epimerase [Granulicella aggregans]|uniref:4-hydroxyproline epimerase n=1 Tax=Granulicella aggregans TaxID=474949 RepID=A0A7W7ZDM2_9BACT|nr:proline racemase family protein [Granulicella aggregans]MBB5057945.1 4-hydroxyproline epimerase [Granulicella aggregans]